MRIVRDTLMESVDESFRAELHSLLDVALDAVVHGEVQVIRHLDPATGLTTLLVDWYDAGLARVVK